MVRKFPGKVSVMSENSLTSLIRTIGQKISEIPGTTSYEKEIQGKEIFENLDIPRGVVLFFCNFYPGSNLIWDVEKTKPLERG